MSTLIMKDPFFITSYLEVGLKLEKAHLELRGGDFIIVLECGHEHIIEGYNPSPYHNLQQCFADIVNFISAWAESLTNGNEDLSELFPIEDEKLKEWAMLHHHELEYVEYELETEGLLSNE